MNATARSPIMSTVAWQPLDSLHVAVLVNDRHRVGIGTHLARPGDVPGGAGGLPDIEVQSVVVGYDVIRGLDAVIDHVFVRLGFQEGYGHAYAFSHPALVVGMLEIPVVEGGLYGGIGRGEPDVSGAIGQPERARDPGDAIGGHVTVERLGPHAMCPFRPFIHDWGGPQQHVVALTRA